MKILCVCDGGNVRSVVLARMFKKRGHEALAVGVAGFMQEETLQMLFNWAEKIVIQKESASKLEKRALKAKEKNLNSGLLQTLRLVADRKFDFRYDLGKDDWYHPDHPDLVRVARNLMETIPIKGEFVEANA